MKSCDNIRNSRQPWTTSAIAISRSVPLCQQLVLLGLLVGLSTNRGQLYTDVNGRHFSPSLWAITSRVGGTRGVGSTTSDHASNKSRHLLYLRHGGLLKTNSYESQFNSFLEIAARNSTERLLAFQLWAKLVADFTLILLCAAWGYRHLWRNAQLQNSLVVLVQKHFRN